MNPADLNERLFRWYRCGVELFQDVAGTLPATVVDEAVGRWNDQQPYQDHLLQPNSPQRGKLCEINSKLAVRLNASQFSHLYTNLTEQMQPVGVYMAVNLRDEDGNVQKLWTNRRAGGTYNFYCNYAPGSDGLTVMSGPGGGLGIAGVTPGLHAVGVLYNGDDSRMDTENLSRVGHLGTNAFSGLCIGDIAGVSPPNIDVFEVVVALAPTQDEHLGLIAYLAALIGVSNA